MEKAEEKSISVGRFKGFPLTLLKLAIMAAVIIGCRLLCSFFIIPAYKDFSAEMSDEIKTLLMLGINTVLIYLVPFTAACLLFGAFGKMRKVGVKRLYRRPQRLAGAMGMFPALYGFAQIFNILTLIIAAIVLMRIPGTNDVLNNTIGSISSIGSAVIMFFYVTIVAPLFEELWLRGVIFSELRQYGVVFAIVFQAVIFGAMHANLYQLLYTTAAGLAFGYIAYMTGSLFATTVLHACFNGISGLCLIFLSTEPVKKIIDPSFSGKIANGDKPLLIAFAIFFIAVLVLAIVGFFMAFKKLKRAVVNLRGCDREYERYL